MTPPNRVLLSCDGTFSKRVAPKNAAIVGKNNAPQNVRVTLTGSDKGGRDVCKDCLSGVL